MAKLLIGSVHYQDEFSGYLREEPGNRYLFTYDLSYLNKKLPAISYTLPLREEPYVSHMGLHPFFDNLVSEGWLEDAQSRLLGKKGASRFELLLAFGYDCAGAVSVIDPQPMMRTDKSIDMNDPKEVAIIQSHASLSGIQPKLMVVADENKNFRLPKINETSTYIAKFPSRHHPDLVVNEYLCTLAHRALLPGDSIVDVSVSKIHDISEEALIIKRFDREGKKKIHFEEFNQLLSMLSHHKYDGSYKKMADFIRNEPTCLPIEIFKLYQRILVGILLGNTDMHYKNFAMFNTHIGLRLTPSYDVVNAAMYNYKTMALSIQGTPNLIWGDLKANNIIKLGREFGLNDGAILMSFENLNKNLSSALNAISNAKWGTVALKNKLIEMMEKRWKGTFALIGKVMSQKR